MRRADLRVRVPTRAVHYAVSFLYPLTVEYYHKLNIIDVLHLATGYPARGGVRDISVADINVRSHLPISVCNLSVTLISTENPLPTYHISLLSSYYHSP